MGQFLDDGWQNDDLRAFQAPPDRLDCTPDLLVVLREIEEDIRVSGYQQLLFWCWSRHK